ncbi:hypothetical protein RF55_8611 [Lasius niger]|uniref:Uncharacterized protein n=1 Tax=Lasius niger TaxID=67767 RepID=A0A0J7KMI0_LASNI|nr:hypothetical protein RF55_8611 [Lasius niger]
MFNHVMDAMVDIQYSRDENEEYVCIGFRGEYISSVRTGQEVSIAAGYLSNINCGLVTATSTRKHTSLVSMAGDEVISRPTMKADTRMRRLTSVVPRSQAVLCLAMETVRDLCPGSVKMSIAQAPWQSVGEKYARAFPKWSEHWTNLLGILRRYILTVNQQACRALLGPVPHHLSMLDERSDESACLVLAHLYLSAYGRLQTPDSYTLTSALGTQQMSRCWHLASLVRKQPSRRWASRASRERDLMGTVYYGMAMAAQNFYSKIQVINSLLYSLRSHFLSYFSYPEFDPSDIDQRFLAAPPRTSPYWSDVVLLC